MLANLKIKTLVIGALGILIGMMVLIGALGSYSSSYSVSLIQDITLHDQKNVTERNAIRLDMETSRSQILQALQHNPGLEWHKLHDHPLSVHFGQIDEITARTSSRWEHYLGSIKTDQEKRMAQDWFDKSNGLGVSYVKAAAQAIQENRWDDAEGILIKNINPSYRIGDGALKALAEFNEQTAVANQESVAANLRNTSYTVIGVLLVGLLISSAVGVVLVRAISVPLDEAMTIAVRVAEGDLTGRIESRSRNEIGALLQALGKMKGSLASIVAEVRQGSDTISSASAQIAAGNMDLSDRSCEQASSLEQTASSMEQLTSTVKQNADNARQANQLAVSASEVAIKGGDVVSQVVETMGSINSSSRKIVDIIGVIDGIAFQTNILALNAAVEAARAGEQGRGFAVVASEVRNLAQRSAAAAKEIKTLIDDSVNQVGSGARLVDQAGATMKEVVASIQRVTDIMGEITQASQEQTHGLEQINKAVGQMDDITQQNVALVEEAAAAAGALQDQAKGLSEIVSVFKLDGEAARTYSAAAAIASQALSTAAAKARPAKTAALPAPSAAAPIQPHTRKRATAGVKAAEKDWEEF
ncbi:methyl-accepting chemotaxis protein [Massilia sp. MB5]|uniref:methyl-accepting chemotaxis protein n=1 Tax=Massilia sp. MB5 TaxID=2919578 RepID=UPI0027D943F4|nr:methyl-accepting chemotaxis protein [Massilia sp. MB5]